MYVSSNYLQFTTNSLLVLYTNTYSDSVSCLVSGKAGSLNRSSLLSVLVVLPFFGDISLPKRLLIAVFLLNNRASSLLILSDSELYFALLSCLLALQQTENIDLFICLCEQTIFMSFFIPTYLILA